MSKFDARLGETYASDRSEWRSWLETNHAIAEGIWLIYYKVKSGTPSVRYPEAVREALCFGWIDSKVQTIDADRYRQIFTPRRPGSIWSKQNKEWIREVTDEGLMTQSGQEKIDAAKIDGSWNSLDAAEALIIPSDFQSALDGNDAARRNYYGFSESQQKRLLFWIYDAKRIDTRVSRIDRILTALTENRMPMG